MTLASLLQASKHKHAIDRYMRILTQGAPFRLRFRHLRSGYPIHITLGMPAFASARVSCFKDDTTIQWRYVHSPKIWPLPEAEAKEWLTNRLNMQITTNLDDQYNLLKSL